MNKLQFFFIGIALSADAFAVSVACGIAEKNIQIKTVFFIAFAFGAFQALMPLAGFFASRFFYDIIKNFDHWIALLLLIFLGSKMIIESFQNETETISRVTVPLILLQGFATSIDALAVGISFAALQTNIFHASAIIGATTFCICLPAVFLGKKIGNILNRKALILGGAILILLGIKIFLEHVL